MTLLLIFVSAWGLMASARAEIPDFKVSGIVTDASTGQPLEGVSVTIAGTPVCVLTEPDGSYTLTTKENSMLQFAKPGFKTRKVRADRSPLNIGLQPLSRTVAEAEACIMMDRVAEKRCDVTARHQMKMNCIVPQAACMGMVSAEEYGSFAENRFLTPLKNPLSTFSTDVDGASYANMRRFVNRGELPPQDAVRAEEFVNYFSYDYPRPQGNDPVRISVEAGACPWDETHRLVRIGIKAREIPAESLPAANFVFLIDVSGSMSGANRLGLVKSSLKLLVNNLRDKDRVAIVTYANNTAEALPSTPGSEKQKIKDAIENLEAGGATAGGAGIQMAYKIAEKNFIADGNNRIILCTDGDFNVGVSDDRGLENLISAKRKTGVCLTVLGYGMGNYKDRKMQILAEKGNGNHAYIDNLQEANKVLVSEFGSTLYTVAKDVKLQVEFNPAKVASYRLVGYESRLLNDEDFNDDTRDAGEMGAGHTVTALYEIIPADGKRKIQDLPGSIDPLRYQQTEPAAHPSRLIASPEMLTVKLRYKRPGEEKSRLLEQPLTDNGGDNVSPDFRFASAVAMYAQLLRDSDFKGNGSYEKVIRIARQGLDNDPEGYRREFIRLVQTASGLGE